ncbi:GNAT family protein [Clostridiaceae bacterium M8S5]|nr:GNAT family protein [Clostridiaceae bacterium M8S5]
MGFDGIKQPKIIQINNWLQLRRPDDKEWKKAIEWYNNEKVMYYSEGITDKIYDMYIIERMYTYLSKIGELYFIETLDDGKWQSIGDVTLAESNLPIVIGQERFWGLGIGKKVVTKLLERATQIGIREITIEIYSYNERSKRLFESLGFIKIGETEKGESYSIKL